MRPLFLSIAAVLTAAPLAPAHAASPAPPPATVAMAPERIREAGISLAAAAPGAIARRVTVPGTVIADADRLVRVPARVAGVVTRLLRRPGDRVAAGETIAVIEGREIAEAKSECLAALRGDELARVTAAREADLWRRRISARQDDLRARADAAQARIRLDLARGRLAAIGIDADEIARLPREPAAALARHAIRAPIAGTVTERTAELGATVAAEARLFTIADLSVLWVEMTVPAAEAGLVRAGQAVRVAGPSSTAPATGEARVIFVGPTLDDATRAARAVAELPDPSGTWRPGTFVDAAIRVAERRSAVTVPIDAVQTIDGAPSVFVRTGAGFERRPVRVGASADGSTEILSGLSPGEPVAAANAFLLKAELGKSDAAED